MGKIRKYAGGAVYTPISRDIYQWPQQSAAAGSSGEAKTDNKIQAAIIKALEEAGIPNDVDYFLNKANSFLQDSGSVFSSSSMDNTMSQLIQVRSLANKIKHNNELYGKAVDRIKTENTGSDIALTNDGKIYVYDGENIKKISAETYSKNREDYSVLTNDDLLHLRERLPNLVYDETILHDISNSVGMKTVMTQVIDTIKKFGTDKQHGYTGKINGQVQRGLEALIAMSPDGLYELEVEDSRAAEDINAAISYLYRNLNENAKHVLRATAAAEGLSPTAGMVQLLKQAVVEHTSGSRSVKYVDSYEELARKRAGSSTKEKSETLTDQPWGVFLGKDSGLPTHQELVLGGNTMFILPGFAYNAVPIPGKSGEVMRGATLADETFYNLNAHGGIDATRTAYFGSTPIHNISIEGKGIIVNNDHGGHVIYAPVDEYGNLDFEAMKEITMIQQDLDSKRISDPAKKKEIWESYGYEYNAQADSGQPVKGALKRFWVQQAYSNTKAPGVDTKSLKNDEMLAHVDNDVINGLISAYNVNPDNKDKQKLKWDTSGLTFRDHFEGYLYIPINENILEAAQLGKSAYIPKPEADQVKASQDAAIRTGSYDYNRGIWNRQLQGTTISALD